MSALPLRPALAAALAATLPLGACGGRSGSDQVVGSASTTAPAPTPDAPPAGLDRAVCEVARQARAGDVAAARTTFAGPVHDDLHRLADELSQADRAVAARLLEAKQRVEAGLESAPGAPDLAASTDELVRATGDGLRSLGRTAEECRP